MTMTARDDYSNELDQAIQQAFSDPLKPNELSGRVRIAYFTFTGPVGDLAVGQNIILCKLPKGARILRGEMVTNTSGAKLDIGLSGADNSGFIDADNSVADDDDYFIAAGDVSGTSKVTFPLTYALNFGAELGKDCYLTATVDTSAFTAAKILRGFVEYVVD